MKFFKNLIVSTIFASVFALVATSANAKCSDNIGAGKATTAANTFNAHFEGKKFKNPYSSGKWATESCKIDDTNVGCTLIEKDGNDSLKISTCYETSCTATGTTTLVDIISLK